MTVPFAQISPSLRKEVAGAWRQGWDRTAFTGAAHGAEAHSEGRGMEPECQGEPVVPSDVFVQTSQL